MRKRPTRRGFVEWLRERGPETYVGRRRSACDCPVANYLHYRCGAPAPTVERQYYLISTRATENVKVLPAWAARVVEAVDKGPALQATAGYVLELMGETA